MAFPLTRLARFELRRFRGVMPKIALVFVLCVPLLYGAIYLTANWDPYGKLSRLPVAVVNDDHPTILKASGSQPATEVHAGADFVDELEAGRGFDYVEVSADEAEAGLRDGRYYLTIHVPQDFSARLISGAGDDPQRAGIMLRRNDANGFVIGSITARAQDEVTQAVNTAAIESYFRAVFANLATIRSGLVDAHAGSAQLADGLTRVTGGADDLADGAHSAAAGADTLAAGAHDLSGGLDTASSGAHELSGGLATLDTKSGQLATGAKKVADGTQQLDDTVLPPLNAAQKALPSVQQRATEISAAAEDITAAAAGDQDSVASHLADARATVDQLAAADTDPAHAEQWNRIKAALTDADGRADDISDTIADAHDAASAIHTAIGGAHGIADKLDDAETKLVALNTGAQQVATGAAQLHSAVGTASAGSSRLADGIDDAGTGADRLSTGATKLATGTRTLATGADTLHSGLSALSAGATKLDSGLADAVRRLPVLSADRTDQAVQVLSSPTDVTMTVENPATYYGRGLAPMFFSIALWVFGISVFLVVRPISGRALAGRASAARLAIGGWLPIGAIALAGSALMIGTVWATLGLAPTHPWLIIAVTLVGSVCFSLIAHLLRTALGTPGSSLLLVWLILQLTSAGGTYPAPLLPGFFATVGKVMPMTYLIDAYRVTISGGLMSHLGRDLAILIITSLIALSLTVLVVARRKHLSMRDLRPALVAP